MYVSVVVIKAMSVKVNAYQKKFIYYFEEKQDITNKGFSVDVIKSYFLQKPMAIYPQVN